MRIGRVETDPVRQPIECVQLDVRCIEGTGQPAREGTLAGGDIAGDVDAFADRPAHLAVASSIPDFGQHCLLTVIATRQSEC